MIKRQMRKIEKEEGRVNQAKERVAKSMLQKDRLM